MTQEFERMQGRVAALQVREELEDSVAEIRELLPEDWQAYIQFSDYQDCYYIRVKGPDGTTFSLNPGAWLVHDEAGFARWPHSLFLRAHQTDL